MIIDAKILQTDITNETKQYIKGNASSEPN